MKKMCMAPLCIAVLVARHAVNAQENGSVKSDELGWINLDCNQQNSKLCQPLAQAQPVGKQAELQPGSAGGNGMRAAKDLEPQERAEVAAADSQVPPDSAGALQPPEKEAVAILELGAEPAGVLAGADGVLAPPWRQK